MPTWARKTLAVVAVSPMCGMLLYLVLSVPGLMAVLVIVGYSAALAWGITELIEG